MQLLRCIIKKTQQRYKKHNWEIIEKDCKKLLLVLSWCSFITKQHHWGLHSVFVGIRFLITNQAGSQLLVKGACWTPIKISHSKLSLAYHSFTHKKKIHAMYLPQRIMEAKRVARRIKKTYLIWTQKNPIYCCSLPIYTASFQLFTLYLKSICFFTAIIQ